MAPARAVSRNFAFDIAALPSSVTGYALLLQRQLGIGNDVALGAQAGEDAVLRDKVTGVNDRHHLSGLFERLGNDLGLKGYGLVPVAPEFLAALTDTRRRREQGVDLSQGAARFAPKVMVYCAQADHRPERKAGSQAIQSHH